MRDRQAAEQRGREGEDRAALWLRAKGWRILARRVRTPLGEIDLIAKRGRTVAFVEVKTRATDEELDYAIDRNRLSRVAAATEAIAHDYAEPEDDIRIDVILIAPGHLPRHIPNAWEA